MINYQNQKVEANGCLGCSYANHEFSLPCGMAYEDENFTLSQDWEVPIPGFLIISPKKHIETFMEMTKYEGLNRVEVSFQTEEEMRDYHKKAWMGKEITSSPLAFDKDLSKLTQEEFLTELEKYLS